MGGQKHFLTSSPIPSNSIPSPGPQNISSFQFPSPDSDGGRTFLLEQTVLKETGNLPELIKIFKKLTGTHTY